MENKIIVEFSREDLENKCDCDDIQHCKKSDNQLIKCNLEYIDTYFKIIKEQK